MHKNRIRKYSYESFETKQTKMRYLKLKGSQKFILEHFQFSVYVNLISFEHEIFYKFWRNNLTNLNRSHFRIIFTTY